jgi:TatD DNase family protein
MGGWWQEAEPPRMLIDTHCHLDAAEFGEDRESVIRQAHAAGVGVMVLPAVQVAAFEPLRALCRAHVGLVYALGIHPMLVDQAQDEDLEHLRKALRTYRDDPALVAVGEIGLDHFVPGLDRGRQSRFFAAQLKLAREFDLPVVLHVRQAQDQVLKHLRQAGVTRGIAHAFNGSSQQAAAFLRQGCVLGFGGAMTFERALRIRRLARELPPEALVLETDAPDISPAWLHPGRNAPAEMARIAETLAGLRGCSGEEVARLTTANAIRALPRLAHWCNVGAHPGAAAASLPT